jgi:hypothetical protein
MSLTEDFIASTFAGINGTVHMGFKVILQVSRFCETFAAFATSVGKILGMV